MGDNSVELALENTNFVSLKDQELRQVNGGGVLFVCLVGGLILLLGFALGYVLARVFG
ncbi:class IIb bacteriocin, lactobin A/cerein 7B family [Enterococcus sp. BWB1-3]|nr:class IIb bacteriocin, lactobin A/cerein 7B family [Enterococcus sp. BWB1-3]MBL1230995.1 class IIb bacteriocin, lactobin A/cerein 7B family [Enterococcus sp. BWB1-3]